MKKSKTKSINEIKDKINSIFLQIYPENVLKTLYTKISNNTVGQQFNNGIKNHDTGQTLIKIIN